MKLTNNGLQEIKLGEFFFKLGLFFLLSIPILSGFFLTIASIFSISTNKINYFTSVWNKYFFSAGIFLVLSATIVSFRNGSNVINPLVNWIGLINWIPYLIFYWAFKPYLNDHQQRRKIIFLTLIGSIPLIVTGIGQYFFDWHGPIILLNGFITWFQRPINPTGGLTGLFNNENYSSLWLLILWPMGLACIKDKQLSKRNRLFFLLITGLTFLCTLLTRAKMARIQLIISYILTFFRDKFILFIPLLVIILILLCILFIPQFINNFDKPLNILSRLDDLKIYEFIENIDFLTRIKIWKIAINSILAKPFFGWGATTFPLIFSSYVDEYVITHTHNIFLELSFNYGILSSILLTIPVLSILFLAFKVIFRNYHKRISQKTIYDGAWWIACFNIIISHMIDIQYYDFRISMIFWILLAGLGNITEENRYKNKPNYSN